ncbi:MAG: MFS transporter, partial [Nitrospirales bacterium]
MTAVPRFLFLCTIGLCSLLSYNAVRMPVLALFAESLGAGPALIGLVVAASTLTGVALKLPAGALSDIYGRHRIMRLALIAFGVPPFLYPFVTDVEVLIGLRFVHGLATALFAPSALAMVAEMFPAHRGASLGWYTASTQAGALLGPVLGGWLVYFAGFPQTFVAGGLIGCVGLLLFFALGLNRADAPTRRSELTSVWSEFMSGLRSAVRNAPVVVTSLADAAKMIANGALMAFLPLYGLSVGLNSGEVGLLFGAQALTSFVSKPVMGRVSDRIGRPPLILFGLVLCAGTFVLIPHVTAWPVLLILSAGFGFGEAVVS